MRRQERRRKPTLSEQVVAWLKRYVLDRSLREGDRLPTEQELARLFGVSRVSVREATKALGFLGLIRAAPRRGISLGRLDPARLTECLGFHFAVSSYPREQLVRARLALETGALAEAMERIADDDREYRRLLACNEELKDARNAAAFVAGDARLHRRILELSGIEPILLLGDLIAVFFRRLRSEVRITPAERAGGIAGHRRLIEALRARRLDEAQRLLGAHLSHYLGAKEQPAPSGARSVARRRDRRRRTTASGSARIEPRSAADEHGARR